MNITKVNHLEISTKTGETPSLPSKVSVELDNGITARLDVQWDEVNHENYKEPGMFTVEGELQLRTYPNPLIKQRADPYIYKHTDGYYYFTGSHPEYDRIVLRRAKTIKGLPNAEESVLWRKYNSGIMSLHIWAPEIHFIDGKWYIHYAAGDKDDIWAIRPYVLENSTANPFEGEWVEKGQINTEFQSFSLDATTFEHNGKRYLIWAQKVENETISNLYIAEMSNPWTIKKQVLLATPKFSWEQEGFYVNEGAAVIKRNGRIFVSYSASATDDRYAMGLLTAEDDSDLLNPKSWSKTKEPVFVSNEETLEYGPGHNSFTVAEDGITDLFVYHSRPYKKIEGNPLYDHNRHTRIQQLFWNMNGTPFFGKPGQTIRSTRQKVYATVIVE
ncbi:Beta-xylosidase, GH43 family [Virgibacillus subterraneus]|uniref:Beta-xylosidase, GH43 family n=1 Tax=Virgibacillus subterraneus TaxID=621109 RepID=A0A1H9B0S6_9BACI|nr:family 43 glycosylhydrolase [Virgibacillus subterraneus]SEP82636.1 Beta-xylosidase, GH43 family [Virgibacillus subterraneus]